MSRSYYVWPRPRSRGKSVYYVQFRLEDGGLSTPKSTGKTSEAAAHEWVSEYRIGGQVVEREKVKLKDFAAGFFSWEGEYIQRRRTRKRKKPIGHRHAANMQAHVSNYLLPYWQDAKLTDITCRKIEEYQDHLIERGLAGATVNAIVHTLLLILREAYDRRLIREMPKPDMVRREPGYIRGILTMKEFAKLRDMEWDNPRAKMVNMLAAATGMRLGEILGLQRRNVFPTEKRIHVETTWEKDTGLKATTKTGLDRDVPVPETIMCALVEMMNRLPWKEPTDLVFPSRNRKTPMQFKTPRESLYRALTRINVPESVRTQRCLDFHSWRAFYNSAMVHARVPKAEIQRTTGHVSDAMTEKTYFRLNDFSNIIAVQDGLFGKEV